MKSPSAPIDAHIQFIASRVAQAGEKIKRAQKDLEAARNEQAAMEKALAYLQHEAGMPVALRGDGDEGQTLNEDKGEVFERFAIRQGAAGFRFTDIFKLYRDYNIEIGKNYPYFLVDIRYKNNLRREGTRTKARFYWTEDEAASK
jgi:hypothetical protein